MEKIVIRTKIVSGISSAIIRESEEEEEICDLINRMGERELLKKIFDEEVLYDVLLKEYEKFRKGIESPFFSWMYVVYPKYGVVLDEHIYLYHYNPQIYNLCQTHIPWGYMESKKYLGDTWWTEDKEILRDLQILSTIEFLDKYKGY